MKRIAARSNRSSRRFASLMCSHFGQGVQGKGPGGADQQEAVLVPLVRPARDEGILVWHGS